MMTRQMISRGGEVDTAAKDGNNKDNNSKEEKDNNEEDVMDLLPLLVSHRVKRLKRLNT